MAGQRPGTRRGAERVPALVALAMSLGLLPGTSAAQPPVPTFTRDVAAIFYARCTTCHRPGQISPMSLLTYKDARPWSRSIRARVAARTMPPWFAEDGHRPLAGDRRLTDNELMTILAWVDGGAPEGDPVDLPPRPASAGDDWQIGAADAVFSLPADVTIPATGPMDVTYVEVATPFDSDRWIAAIEVRPGDQARVHAATVYWRSHDARSNAEPSEPGQVLTFYASGADPLVLPDGMAMRLPAGAVLVFAIHYAPNGTPGRDRTRLAVRFAPAPPQHEVRIAPVGATGFVIPPGAPEVRVQAQHVFDGPVRVLGLVPHAHRRGRSFVFRLTDGEGGNETILAVPRFNWLWETSYLFAESIAAVAGATIEVTAVFDNSAANKANPDPRRDVPPGWDPVTREMMQAYIIYAAPRSR